MLTFSINHMHSKLLKLKTLERKKNDHIEIEIILKFINKKTGKDMIDIEQNRLLLQQKRKRWQNC